MRTLVDIPDADIRKLSHLSAKRKVSRAALIREAITGFLARNEPERSRKKAFGIWRDLEIDSVEYQRKLRDEW